VSTRTCWTAAKAKGKRPVLGKETGIAEQEGGGTRIATIEQLRGGGSQSESMYVGEGSRKSGGGGKT